MKSTWQAAAYQTYEIVIDTSWRAPFPRRSQTQSLVATRRALEVRKMATLGDLAKTSASTHALQPQNSVIQAAIQSVIHLLL